MSDVLFTSAAYVPAADLYPHNEPLVQVPVVVYAKETPEKKARPRATASLKPSRYLSSKPFVDRLITALIMPVALPLMGMAALAILVTDGRPIFYRQTRVGKNGRHFRIWKFRTMTTNAEFKTGAVWSSANDARVTPLGQWLRCAHIDEMPQFFNVLRGEMNLVGPRPERPEFVQELSRELSYYHQRLAVSPGITGLAQLRLGYDSSLADVEKKVQLDLEYVAGTTLWSDLGLMAQTLPYIARKLIDKWLAFCQERGAGSSQSAEFEPTPEVVSPATAFLPVPHIATVASLPAAPQALSSVYPTEY